MTITVAPLWRRTLAALIDLAAVLALFWGASWLIITSDPSPPDIPPWNPFDRVVDYIQHRPGRTALLIVTLCIIHIAWTWAWSARSDHHAGRAAGIETRGSLGHRILGLGLIDARGRRPSAGRMLGWLAARLPSTFVAGLGLWWALVDTERRTLHDRLAGVWVVDARPPRPPSA